MPATTGARASCSRKTEKAIQISLDSLYLCRRRPTLPHTFACSTIGPAGLNFRVRDGNGWIPRGKITDKIGCQLSAVSLYRARADDLLIQQTFKEREDETSQLNRWAETLQATSLQGFCSAHSVSTLSSV